jgi:hypothetical protein
MDGRYVEPRQVMWAVAEIIWEDDRGMSFRVPAILEDTSKSGACIRVKRPLAIGSRLIIKWHREQFSAVARNCRRDGGDFLLGVCRAPEVGRAGKPEPAPVRIETKSHAEDIRPPRNKITPRAESVLPSMRVSCPADAIPARSAVAQRARPATAVTAASHFSSASHTQGTLLRPERKVMERKTIFPHFWRRKQDGHPPDEGATANSKVMEASVNKSSSPESTPSGPRGELLGYEDIYRATGIMGPGAGYGIHKVVDMLNSERLRDLSNDAKRASVLMALDAAGISADDLLTDATRRQNALTSYESSQVKQLEDFEARKAKENSKIEEEMEKIRAHYTQRIQSNLDQVAKEKEALRNWQMAMQHETQRIAEVIELCGKQPAPAAKGSGMAAAAGAQAAEKPEVRPQPVGSAPARPTLSGR